MKRVKGKLCRTAKGKFTRCRGAAGKRKAGKRKSGRAKACRFGVNKITGRCLKNPRPC
jgi:hypothetical protein